MIWHERDNCCMPGFRTNTRRVGFPSICGGCGAGGPNWIWRRAMRITRWWSFSGCLPLQPTWRSMDLTLVPHLSRLRAQALAALGHLDDAEAELQGTLPVASKQGQRWMLWRLHADLGSVYRAMGRRDAAEREFSSARTIIQDLANHVPEGALRDNFLKQALAALPAAPALRPRQLAKKEFGGLTAREREVATLISQGKSNREIADELVIGETTAERHVANILSRLGFNSRIQIAAMGGGKGPAQIAAQDCRRRPALPKKAGRFFLHTGALKCTRLRGCYDEGSML